METYNGYTYKNRCLYTGFSLELGQPCPDGKPCPSDGCCTSYAPGEKQFHATFTTGLTSQDAIIDFYKIATGTSITQNEITVSILQRLGFALGTNDTVKDIVDNSNYWVQGCPGGKNGLADNITGEHNCRVYYYWKYQQENSFSSWLKSENCMGYTWAMDEFQCTGSPTGTMICGANVSKTNQNSDIPSIYQTDLWDYWKCKDTNGVCTKPFGIPASSCGYRSMRVTNKVRFENILDNYEWL